MSPQQPDAFIEQALVKVCSRSDRAIKSIVEDLNVNYHALKSWMKNKPVVKRSAP